MDVADLKKTNDREGHVAGDRLLTTLASIVQANTRSADLLGRMGGDEFLLVMPETDSAHAETVARKLIALLAEGTTDGPPVRVSVGVAGSPEIEHVSEALIAAADKVLVAAKRGNQRLVVAKAAGGL
jgi:diguanylate cyclase (GGDEF)-like protein